MVMVVKMMMMRGVLCVRERVKERERQRDSEYQKHSSLSKCKSTITQRLINDRRREEKRWYRYTLLPFPEPTVCYTILLAKKLSWVVCFPGVGYFVERLETWIISKPWQRSLHFTCSCAMFAEIRQMSTTYELCFVTYAHAMLAITLKTH